MALRQNITWWFQYVATSCTSILIPLLCSFYWLKNLLPPPSLSINPSSTTMATSTSSTTSLVWLTTKRTPFIPTISTCRTPQKSNHYNSRAVLWTLSDEHSTHHHPIRCSHPSSSSSTSTNVDSSCTSQQVFTRLFLSPDF